VTQPLRRRGGLRHADWRHDERRHVDNARGQKLFARSGCSRCRLGHHHRMRRNLGDAIDAGPRDRPGVDYDVVVAMRQGVEGGDDAARSENLQPVGRGMSRRDQVQRRQPVLGDDVAERRHAMRQFGKAIG